MPQELGKEYYEEMHRKGGVQKAYHKGAKETFMCVLWYAIAQRLGEEDEVAEFGCGAGQLASLIMERGVYYEYGVDIAEYGIELARKHNPGYEYKFKVRNLYDLSAFNIAPYNTAIFCEVLEHLADDIKVLSYVPAGTRVIISVPTAESREHVRCFKSNDEVKEHYGSTIDIREIETVLIPINNPGNEHYWFIIDGVKK